MKKILTVLTLTFLMSVKMLFAQIPNNGFETLNSNNNLSNWSLILLQAVLIDSNGVSHYDSIVFLDQLYAQTNDAHSGSYALEMKNALNVTQNLAIGGGAILSAVDTDYSVFLTPVFIQGQPTDFNFYYKYFPTGNDSAFAYVSVYDSTGFQIGEATIILGGTVAAYTFATTPIVYSMPYPAAFITMEFRTQIPGVQPTFGTRFLVDDVSMPGITGISEIRNNEIINVYPNPSNGKFTVLRNINSRKVKLTVKNYLGEDIFDKAIDQAKTMVDISDQPEGIYYIQISTENGKSIKRIVVCH